MLHGTWSAPLKLSGGDRQEDPQLRQCRALAGLFGLKEKCEAQIEFGVLLTVTDQAPSLRFVEHKGP